jgi:hypothetical protein
VKNAGTKAGSLGARKIIAVTSASLCPSKTVLQPICTGCNVAQELRPLPSALYVLMDLSASDQNNLGPTALATALGISFTSPVFRNTYVAFGFMPDVAGNRCSLTTPYATPAVNFDLAPVVQTGVANLFQTTHPANDAPLDIDAALQSRAAYAVFQNLKSQLAGPPPVSPEDQPIFNRLAVMLLFNRSAADQCGLGAVNEAAAALGSADKIYTYVIQLQPPTLPVPDTTPAKAIANAGGTSFIDGTDGSLATEGTALAQIISDLGSCQYYIPQGMDASWNVSYLLGGVPTAVPQNGQCNAASETTVDGWAIDGDRVRICGPSCANIRTSLTEASLVAATGQPVPYTPISATQTCK